MRIHHLNCGCMCPVGGALFDGFSRGITAHLVCHCLLIETDSAGLVLVDTGFGLEDMRQPQQRLTWFFRLMNNIQYRQQLTARYQIEALGFRPDDVRHIVLTHLDFDHAGGLSDFPQARVHLLQQEIDTATHRHGWLSRERYRPAQWSGSSGWQGYQAEGEAWFGFQAVRSLHGLPPEILLIPLPGHTHGHAGVAIRHAGGWLLHGGDAWFYRDEITQSQPHCTPGLRFYQWLMQADSGARRTNQQRLRTLYQQQGDELTLFCSHDALELKRLQIP